MASSEVRVRKVLLIPPSEPTPTRTLSLSSLDSQPFLRFTIEYLLIYTPSHPYDNASSAAHVRAALGKALIPYYPLAGRVRSRAGSSGLEVLCRAQGVGFIEAVSRDTASDFGHAPGSVSEWREMLTLDAFKVIPPLVVQLTWLADGSAALAAGFEHCVCDGVGSSAFLNLFAQLATGKSKLGEFKPVPVWDRHIIDSTGHFPKIPTATGYHPEFVPVPDICGFFTRFSQEKLVPTSTTFEKHCLNGLKNLAGRPISMPICGYTSFEVLAAHIWRSWARSLNFPPEQNLKLLFSVNIRKRIDPSLPEGYYGNAFVLGCAQTRAKDLVEKGLGYVCGLVKKAKDKVGDTYLRQVVDIVSRPGHVGPDLVGVLIISQWSRLGLDHIDFGLGKPVHVGPVCSDRYCLMLPVGDRPDAVKVMVAVPNESVNRFEYLLRCPYA